MNGVPLMGHIKTYQEYSNGFMHFPTKAVLGGQNNPGTLKYTEDLKFSSITNMYICILLRSVDHRPTMCRNYITLD